MRPPRWLIATGCVIGLLGAGTVWGFAQTTAEQDITCHIDASNVLSCPLPSPSTETATVTTTETAPGPTTTVPGPTTTETQTVPGPTTTVPGPTTTVPGPTTTVPGPTTTVPGPTTTVTTTVTATPTPTPTTTAPAPPGFPNGTNTGVPAGTTLVVVNGNQTYATAGQVIDSKDIRGCVTVTATNVTIKNSKITCTGGRGVDSVYSQDHGYTGQRVLIQDSEISCGVTNGTAIGEANITANRVNIHDCENGFDVNQSITVTNSWIHAVYNGGGAHADGIQFAKHITAAGAIANGAVNITITGNRIESWDPANAQGTSAIITDGWHAGGDTNILIQANLLDGGAFTLYCEAAPGPNYRILDNHFGRRAAYGPTSDCNHPGVTFTGNVWNDTSQPVPAA